MPFPAGACGFEKKNVLVFSWPLELFFESIINQTHFKGFWMVLTFFRNFQFESKINWFFKKQLKTCMDFLRTRVFWKSTSKILQRLGTSSLKATSGWWAFFAFQVEVIKLTKKGLNTSLFFMVPITELDNTLVKRKGALIWTRYSNINFLPPLCNKHFYGFYFQFYERTNGSVAGT